MKLSANCAFFSHVHNNDRHEDVFRDDAAAVDVDVDDDVDGRLWVLVVVVATDAQRRQPDQQLHDLLN